MRSPMYAYAGRMLRVDLSRGILEPWEPPQELYHDYIGGSGIAARLLFEVVREIPDLDPFDPRNPLIIMTGPATGTALPGSNRFVTCALSPLTGIWGESNCGGYFGPWLKRAGYDGLIITGQAPRPTYLSIVDGVAALHDASDLWGLDSYETTDLLTERHKADQGRPPQVFAIGQAGEQLVRFAAIVNNKGHIAGRTGMGAVMGSKRLKAIVADGHARQTPADQQALRGLTQRINERLRDNIMMQALKEMGTAAELEIKMFMGDVPSRNWTVGEWRQAVDTLGGSAMYSTILVDTKTCYACQVKCKRVVEVPRNPFMVKRGAGPEYEACVTFGTLILNDNLEAVAKANDLCNRYGLDTISCGATIALAYECYEKGLISCEETGGVPLTWGDAAAAIELIHQIAGRRGLGHELAEGSLRFAQRRGSEALEGLTTVKGLEAPMHDPRGTHALGLAYATSVIGASHMNGIIFAVASGQVFYDSIPGLEPFMSDDPRSPHRKALMTVNGQNIDQIYGQALALCHFSGNVYSEYDLALALTALTGVQRSVGDLLEIGDRLWNLKRAIGCLRGLTAADDKLPARLMTPLKDGDAAGLVPDMQTMLAEFYELRELDEQGYPKRERLERLGLEDVSEVLHSHRARVAD